jgi:xanthine dehydrogenase accessory factor
MSEILERLPIPVSATPADVLRRASDALARCMDCCVATVVSRSGSAPSTPGQKLLICSDGTAAGTVGGGAVERVVVQGMQEVLAKDQGEPHMVSYALHKDLGMACGGSVELMIEPLWASTPVLIVGAGHIGFCVARLLPGLGFSVLMVDERPATLAPDRISLLEGVKTALGTPDQVAKDLPRRGAVVVATHEHDRDVAAVVWAVTQGFAYVGGVGSKAKAARVRQTLKENGVENAAVRMPVGVEIGARTPEEIAVSIAADLIAWRSQTEPRA